MVNEVITINSKELYLGKNFEDIKETIRKNNRLSIDMGSFIAIEYENYDIILNQILNMSIYLKCNDSYLNTRIKQIEKNIKETVDGFSFKTDCIN